MIKIITELDVVCSICTFSFVLFFSAFKSHFVIQIKWENRNIRANSDICRVSIDGTDFRIYEPTPFSPRWFSHKFKGPGLRYEVGVAIHTGWLVWIHGSFPCGEWPDLRIAHDALIYCLDPGELYVADAGYGDGNQYSLTPNGLHNFDQWQMATVRARHETVNKRFKQWGALKRVFRHDLQLHSNVFRAIANITQLSIRNGEPLFDVEFNYTH